MKSNQDLAAGLYKLKARIEAYVLSREYNPVYTFGFFLKEYVEALNKKRKVFANEIGIDEAMLSNYINHHRIPPDYICVRLEIHSKSIILAEYWYKLIEKGREHYIKTDKELRKSQEKFVHSRPVLIK